MGISFSLLRYESSKHVVYDKRAAKLNVASVFYKKWLAILRDNATLGKMRHDLFSADNILLNQGAAYGKPAYNFTL
jgi:hypothetical protein